MADNCIQIVTMGDSSDDNEEKYEIYEAGSDMLCVVGVGNKQMPSKMQGLKPKYKQSYREAWESMRDFKGWLTSVPGNNTKAYCKLCEKELHCHRLSLLKHKVTFKHHKKEEEQKLINNWGEKSEKKGKRLKEVQNENIECVTPEELEKLKESSDNDINENDLDTNKGKVEISSTYQENMKEAEPKIGSLSTHILDISKGVPAALVQVVLYKLIKGRWTLLDEGLTSSEGCYNYIVSKEDKFPKGRYKMHFDVDKYFEKQNQETIFPFIEVAFDVKDMSCNYHIPVLLSPFGYSIYRGS